MIGLIDRERVDAALYDDYETEKAREVSTLLAIFLVAFDLCGMMLEKIARRFFFFFFLPLSFFEVMLFDSPRTMSHP